MRGFEGDRNEADMVGDFEGGCDKADSVEDLENGRNKRVHRLTLSAEKMARGAMK